VKTSQHILISRTDAIGDVVLTLPMCGYLKKVYPDCRISFLGRSYTEAVINTSQAVDEFVNYDELKNLPIKQQADKLKALKIDTIVHVYPRKEIANLAKFAGIKTRIGTTNRAFHWLSCNKLVKLSRKNSNLHEAQLNIRLLEPLDIKEMPAISELPIYYHFKSRAALPEQFKALMDDNRLNIILHPKSNGSGKEWDLKKFAELIDLLPKERYRVFISGSEKERLLLKDWITVLPDHVIDLTGKFELDQFIAFIAEADGLVAASTGPLHLAALAGIHALGLYPTKKPGNPGRWGPIGKLAEHIDSGTENLDSISAKDVCARINDWKK